MSTDSDRKSALHAAIVEAVREVAVQHGTYLDNGRAFAEAATQAALEGAANMLRAEAKRASQHDGGVAEIRWDESWQSAADYLVGKWDVRQ